MNNAMRLQIPAGNAAPGALPNHVEDRIGRDELSALVCCHEPTYCEFLTGQLRAIGYKVHHADGHQKGCERLTARSYDLTILLENLESCALVDNELLRHIMLLPTDERRRTFVVMLCQSFTTNDERAAYAWSVDMLINYQDIAQFGSLVVPVIEEHNESNRFFNSILRKAA